MISGKGAVQEIPRFAPVIKYVVLFDIFINFDEQIRRLITLWLNSKRRKEKCWLKETSDLELRDYMPKPSALISYMERIIERIMTHCKVSKEMSTQ